MLAYPRQIRELRVAFISSHQCGCGGVPMLQMNDRLAVCVCCLSVPNVVVSTGLDGVCRVS